MSSTAAPHRRRPVHADVNATTNPTAAAAAAAAAPALDDVDVHVDRRDDDDDDDDDRRNGNRRGVSPRSTPISVKAIALMLGVLFIIYQVAISNSPSSSPTPSSSESSSANTTALRKGNNNVIPAGANTNNNRHIMEAVDEDTISNENDQEQLPKEMENNNVIADAVEKFRTKKKDAAAVESVESSSTIHLDTKDTTDQLDADADADTTTPTDTADADDDAETEADADAKTDADVETDADADAGSDAKADTGSDAKADTGSDAKADTGSDADADAKADTDADADAETETSTNPAFDKEYDNCIVGAGLSGSVIAENYANLLSQTSLIIERRHHIGGNCYDYIDEDTGIRVSLFGAHLFHTKHQRVWDYVQRFGKWEPYEHRVLGLVNGKHVPIPVTIDTVNILFDLNITDSEEMDVWLEGEQVKLTDKKGKPREALNSEEVALTRVGPRLYNLIFKPYTYKQWAKYPAELGPEVLSRIPFRNNFDGRYFSDQYQALPKKGYTSLFEKMLDSPLITVVKNTDFFDVKDQLKCKRLYYTGPIDTYFADLKWPKLEYRSLSFERVVQKNTPGYFQPAPVVNYPQAEDVDGNPVDYTRIVEYKHLLNQTSKHTIYFIERSTDDGEPYYPVPNDVNKNLYIKYQKMAEKEKGVTFVGRLANYKYFNMDDAILNALELFDRDTEGMVK